MLYSFIIPHYNIPALLQRCIDSIPKRSDIEIIVVDDASDIPPKCLRDDVKLITLPEHCGAGAARNAGLKAATGKWVLFPDSDDFYNPDFINTLDKYSDSDIEILYFSVNSCDSETLAINHRRSKGIKQYIEASAIGDREAQDNLFYKCTSACFKMYSRQFLTKWNITFEEISRCNDVRFSLNANYHVNNYAISTEELYCITYRKGSLSYSQRSWSNYVDTVSTSIKRNEFYNAIGQQKYKLSFINFFIGFDNPLKRRNLAEELCNCIVYAVKVALVLIMNCRKLYRSRKEYCGDCYGS